MLTVAVSSGFESESKASPLTCPFDGASFQEKVGMFAGSAKMGVCPAGSYRVAPFTDLPVVNPEANSAKGRAGVVTGAGIANGLFVTAMLLVAIEKKMTPLRFVPPAGVSVRRVWRSVPSMALLAAP